MTMRLLPRACLLRAAVVVQNRAAHNIRVVNLSLVSSLPEPYQVSPLAAAVELAWLSGVVVVVSAGNLGPDTVLYPPASDPSVITVGAVDTNGTPDQVKNPLMSTARSLASPGAGRGEVDTLATVSLNSPGYANQNIPLNKGWVALAGTAAYNSATWDSATWNSATWNSATWNSARPD